MSGTRAVREALLDPPDMRDLRISIVWVPMLDDDELPIAASGSAQFAKWHVTQYWDGKKHFSEAMLSSVGFPESSAWGTYLYYQAGSTWDEQGVPRPDIVIKEVYGVIVANQGALPRIADQSGLPGGFSSCCEVVGESATNLGSLLHDAARSMSRSPRAGEE